ncbi:MAG: hypothetical protein AAGA54_09645 [Myxococcota bacterium]
MRRLSLLLLAIALAACSHRGRAKPASSSPPPYADPGSDRGYDPGYAGSSSDGGGSFARESAPAPASDEAYVAERSSRRRGRETRHGLGTEYGERRHSDSYAVRFERASSSPDALYSLWYDDFEGVRSVSDSGWRQSAVSDYDGLATVSIVDRRGRLLDALDAGGQRYAIGKPGKRYELEIVNHTGRRYEVVASVDGLDVIDGGRASTNKRGYVLEPFETLVIDGWRTSDDTVAAFRFDHVADSYAARTGEGRNIGVIGVALFEERGRWEDDRIRRRSAEPFDDRYAPPPPRRW